MAQRALIENVGDSRLPFGETSAAQNGTVIKTCQQCGAVNGDPSNVCCFCDAPLGGLEHSSLSRRVTTLTDAKLAAGVEWRQEVSSRLHDYRVRRQGFAARDVQTALPFDSESDNPYDSPGPSTGFAAAAAVGAAASPAAAPARKANGARARHSERFEISIPMLEAPVAANQGGWQAVPHAGEGERNPSLFSVAPLADRRRAAVVDAALLIFSYGGMLALFTVLGGRIGFNKLDLTVAGVTFALFYAQYFALFTVFGGSTPGMMLRGLRVVSFQGAVPTSRQMAWRSFGYLISAGTCFLGFFWALWDDDQLCWHDRISQTYLAPTEELTTHRAGISQAE